MIKTMLDADNITLDSTPVGNNASHSGIVITATSPHGGAGKSTVSLLLASQLVKSSQKAYLEGKSEREIKVCVIDLDVVDGHLGFFFNNSTPSVLNLCLSDSPLDTKLVQDSLVYSETMGIHALLAPIAGKYADYLEPSFYVRVIEILKTMFDVIIIDTPIQHNDSFVKDAALPESDAILLVTKLDSVSLQRLYRWISSVTSSAEKGGHGIDASKIGIIVNSYTEGNGIGNKQFEIIGQGARLLSLIPFDEKAIQTAGNIGRLETILTHPEIGPAYYKLAKTLARAAGVKLSPLVD